MPNSTDPKNLPISTAPASAVSISDLPAFMDPSIQTSGTPSPAPEDTQNEKGKPSFLTVEEPAIPDTSTPAATNSVPNSSPISTPPPVNNTSVSLNTSQNPVGGSTKKIVAILGIVGLVAATVIGVIAVGSNRLKQSSAWDCQNYVFAVSPSGEVTATNGSSHNEPLQKAEVKINGSTVQTFDVPALAAGEHATLGTVNLPSDSYTWEVIGSLDCQNAGNVTAQPSTSPSSSPSLNQISCSSVSAFDINWQPLSSSQLSALQSGDKIRFTVSGNASNGSFDQARFTINGTQRASVIDTKPGSDEFFDEYTIPSDVTNISVEAQVHHVQTDTWY